MFPTSIAGSVVARKKLQALAQGAELARRRYP